MNIDEIKKLPPDAKRQFVKYAQKLAEKKKGSQVSFKFLKFVKHVWPQFIEGSHHKIIAEKFNDIANGKIKRLIINMPPRHTKSEFASNLLPAWMVGRKPDLKIIQTTHTTELAIRFGRKAKTLIDSLSINKYLKQDSEKIHKLRVNGKPSKEVNTMQLVWARQSRAVVRTY